jgi:hypothetical protein
MVLRASLVAVIVAGAVMAEMPPVPQPDGQAVADVKAGRRTEANAAWWGFDAADATAALQGAIDSGARRVVVPNVGRPWVVRPIRLRGDLELVFEKGVEVVAKPGAFPGLRDYLFSAENCSNLSLIGSGAVLRMQKPEYTEGEWRHALAILSCRSVKVAGLTLKDSGGDGIYLGRAGRGAPAANENIHIKDVTCDGNRRQGISIITAKDLVIEDCAFVNTGGTAPQAGIDFEPNSKDEKLANCIVRRCRIENNRGPGFTLNLNQMDKTTEDVSIRVEDCRISGSGREGIGIHRIADNGPGGLIEFDRCVVRYGPTLGGLTVSGKSPDRARVRFSRCVWQYDAAAPPPEKPRAERSAIVLGAAIKQQPQRTGGIEFVDCVVEDPRAIPFLKGSAPKDLADPWKDIRGTILVKGPGAAVDLGGAKIDLKVETGAPGTEGAATAPQAEAEKAMFCESVVWEEHEGGLAMHHVYGLAVTAKGTVLAFTEGRIKPGDEAPHHLLLRRGTLSPGGGVEWSPERRIEDGSADGGTCWTNAAPVVDRQTGRVFFFYARNEGSRDQKSTRVFYKYSDDDGITWMPGPDKGGRIEITSLFEKNQYGWTFHMPGPGHGIQLGYQGAGGTNGRLIVPVWHRKAVTARPRVYGVSVIYSDDHGATWKSGGDAGVSHGMNESRIAELADGTLLMNARGGQVDDKTTTIACRIQALSKDGGELFLAPTVREDLRYFQCDSGMVRYTGSGAGDRGVLLLSHPADPKGRTHMTVSMSFDDGATWPRHKLVYDGGGCYSDLAILPDGTIGLLYGKDVPAGQGWMPRRVVFARFNWAWLKEAGHE